MSDADMLAELVDATRCAKRGAYANDERLTRAAFAIQDELDRLRADIARLTAELAARQAFKDYVHTRLDDAGVPVDPPSPHRDAGCRIGGRLDWLLAELAAAKERERAATIIPGCMKCAKCGFGLVRTTLCVGSGTAFAGNNETEPCPNGCGPLWPETWESRARDVQRVAEEALDRERVLHAFVRAWDSWLAGTLWPDACVSKILRADLHAAREAVGPCS